MRRLIWLPLAGFLLVAGAAIAAAASAPSVTPLSKAFQDTSSPAPSAASASPSTNPDPNSGGMPEKGMTHTFGFGIAGAGADLLDQVLADLVKAGTITQAQSDAITGALGQAITDQQAQIEQERRQTEQEWTQIQGFLEDGTITQDEVDQLPADSPFRQVFDSIAQDGQVTLDQLMQLRPFGPGGPGGPGKGGPGMHFHVFPGPGYPGDGDQDQNPEASPSTTGTSS